MSQPAAGGTSGDQSATAPGRPQSKRLQQTQAQVDEVVGIMKVNVEKVLERDAKLSQLDDRAVGARTSDTGSDIGQRQSLEVGGLSYAYPDPEMQLRWTFVVTIMKSNMEKVLERDNRLSALDARADALQEGASQFEKSAATLKRKYWWKNCKMIIILCAIVCIIIIIIVVWAVSANQ